MAIKSIDDLRECLESALNECNLQVVRLYNEMPKAPQMADIDLLNGDKHEEFSKKLDSYTKEMQSISETMKLLSKTITSIKEAITRLDSLRETSHGMVCKGISQQVLEIDNLLVLTKREKRVKGKLLTSYDLAIGNTKNGDKPLYHQKNIYIEGRKDSIYREESFASGRIFESSKVSMAMKKDEEGKDIFNPDNDLVVKTEMNPYNGSKRLQMRAIITKEGKRIGVYYEEKRINSHKFDETRNHTSFEARRMRNHFELLTKIEDFGNGFIHRKDLVNDKEIPEDDPFVKSGDISSSENIPEELKELVLEDSLANTGRENVDFDPVEELSDETIIAIQKESKDKDER